jgi:hypothetical protein
VGVVLQLGVEACWGCEGEFVVVPPEETEVALEFLPAVGVGGLGIVFF